MKSQNVYTDKRTLAELERELKRDVAVDREIDGGTTNSRWIKVLMDKIECMRQERLNVSNEYTQKKLAEKAGLKLREWVIAMELAELAIGVLAPGEDGARRVVAKELGQMSLPNGSGLEILAVDGPGLTEQNRIKKVERQSFGAGFADFAGKLIVKIGHGSLRFRCLNCPPFVLIIIAQSGRKV